MNIEKLTYNAQYDAIHALADAKFMQAKAAAKRAYAIALAKACGKTQALLSVELQTLNTNYPALAESRARPQARREILPCLTDAPLTAKEADEGITAFILARRAAATKIAVAG